MAPSEINAWLDRIPRMWFVVGPRRVPAFRSLGIVGFHVAVVAAVLTSLRVGVPLGSTLGLSAVAGFSFFGWGLLRRAVTRRESLVLIEYVWVAYGAVAAFAAASGLAVAPVLDVYSVAVAPFLAFGRFGCTVVGCCHGTPTRIGLRYGPQHGLADRLTDRRLFPVQPIEAAALLVIGMIGFAIAPGRPGTATVWFLSAYAVLRFGCERLRGDRRPVFGGVPVPQAMCAVQLTAAVAAAEAWLVPGPPGRATVAAAAVLLLAAISGLTLRTSRPSTALAAPDHLDEIWRLVQYPVDERRQPNLTTTSAGMSVAVSLLPTHRHVSFSHPDLDTMCAAFALGGRSITEQNGIVHLALPDAASAVRDTRGHQEARDERPDVAVPVDAALPTDTPRPSETTSAISTTTSSRGYFHAPEDFPEAV